MPWILGGLAIVVVGAIAWGIFNARSQQASAAAWSDYYFNLGDDNLDPFIDLADNRPGTDAAQWALLTAGEGYLSQGMDELYTNKAEGLSMIELAVEQLEQVEDASRIELREKALLGLARAHETLGDIDKAKSYYEQVRSVSSLASIQAAASQRLSFLDSDEGKAFYTWFESFDPKPDAPIELSPDFQSPPTSPDLDFSNTPDAEVDTSGLPAPDLGTANDTPAGDGPPLPLEGNAGPAAPASSEGSGDTGAESEGTGTSDESTASGSNSDQPPGPSGEATKEDAGSGAEGK
ncbi:MAG TPA: hypothetical protein DDW52_13030 [Planctomycetaceae bacterium]|nr:hypothetical protein [Planctomycetaceae bacterium]